MPHQFEVQAYRNALAVRMVCIDCTDPEPDTVDYIWTDSDGTVYFDGCLASDLFSFMAHHEAFGITDMLTESGIVRAPGRAGWTQGDADAGQPMA